MKFDPSKFDAEAQASAKEHFEQFQRTESDRMGSLEEAPPLVYAKIAQKGVTDENGQPLVMPGAVVFFTSTEGPGEYMDIEPRATMDAHPYEPFEGVFAGGSKGRIYWGPKGTIPQKGKEPRCKSMNGIEGIPAEDFISQIPDSGLCIECPFRLNGCNDTRAFVIAIRLSEDEAENFGMPFYPVIMQFTKSAIPFIAKYNQWVTGRGKACLGPLLGVRHEMYWHDIVTKMTCQYTSRKGGYYTPDFEYMSLVNPDIVPQVRALRETSLDRMLPAATESTMTDSMAVDC